MTETASTETILLVEDDPIIALYEASILEKDGYSVTSVYSSEKALETATDGQFNLVLMDIDLGKGKTDGTETAQAILQRKELPIVFLTSHGEKEMVDRVKGITRYGYVLKSAGEFVLLESVHMALELFAAHQQARQAVHHHASRVLCEEELLALYNHTPVLLVLLDKERRIRRANAFAAEFAGTPAEDMIGERGGEALRCLNSLNDPRGCGFGPECAVCMVRRTVMKTFETKMPFTRVMVRLPFRRKSKVKLITFLLSTSQVVLNGEPHVIASMEDVTDLTQAVQETEPRQSPN
jgi:CheY-like chemotaxis protein